MYCLHLASSLGFLMYQNKNDLVFTRFLNHSNLTSSEQNHTTASTVSLFSGQHLFSRTVVAVFGSLSCCIMTQLLDRCPHTKSKILWSTEEFMDDSISAQSPNHQPSITVLHSTVFPFLLSKEGAPPCQQNKVPCLPKCPSPTIPPPPQSTTVSTDVALS